MNYSANDNLDVMKIAKNYNNFLISNILKLINSYNYQTILDFGCSDGFFIEEILKINNRLNIEGIEKDSTSIQNCKDKNIKIYDDLSLINKCYDLIYSFNVLEHIEDDVTILKEFNSKLNNNGKLLLYVPAFNFLFSSMDKKTGHFRRYSKKDLIKKLEISNFKIEQINYCDFIGGLLTLIYILKDKIKSSNGNINKVQIKLFDMLFPLDRLLDKLLFSNIFGKNILVVASKI